MRVLDHHRAWWTLFEEAGVLLLDVYCSHSAAGYDIIFPLSAEEKAEYALKGRDYLGHLADAVQQQGPYSDLQQRNVYDASLREAKMAAIEEWWAAHPEDKPRQA